jgi:hypothetical protein
MAKNQDSIMNSDMDYVRDCPWTNRIGVQGL